MFLRVETKAFRNRGELLIRQPFCAYNYDEMLHQGSHTSYLFSSPAHVPATLLNLDCDVDLPDKEGLRVSVSLSIQSHLQKKVYFLIRTHVFQSLLRPCPSLFSNITLRWQPGDSRLNSTPSFLNFFLLKDCLNINVFISQSCRSQSGLLPSNFLQGICIGSWRTLWVQI